jgi:hypothetical protein
VTSLECPREADVLDAVASQRWPHRADDELREHVSACGICADVAEVAWALRAEDDTVRSTSGTLPPASVVWLRAQARARAEASRQAARPVAIMQALGLACAAGVASLLIGIVAFWVWSRTDWINALPELDLVGLSMMNLAIRGTLLAIGFWLVLAPVAVYLAAADD